MLSHTADAVVEAWGPTAEACYEEAVDAFVSLFAGDERPQGAVPVAAVPMPFELGPGTGSDLLVLLLEEVLFVVEVAGRVPVGARVSRRGDYVVGELSTVALDVVVPAGAVPKGVSYEDLRFEPVADGWRCRATVDV